MRKSTIALAAGVLAAGSLLVTPLAAPANAHPYCDKNFTGHPLEYPACERACTNQAARGIPCPGEGAPATTRPQAPNPATTPVQTPKINPPGRAAPKNAARVAPPKHVEAPSQAVAAAKAAPPTHVDPANPPKPPTPVDFNHQVNGVVSGHPGNVETVNAANQTLARPRVWDYVDYDQYHRPALYNPLTEPMTFRYFYNRSYQQVSVAAGARTVLNAAAAGLFPFTAVSDSYAVAGSFTGGAWIPPDGWAGPPPADYTPPAAPEVYQDVSASVPADNQTVQVGQVTVVGHDASQPTGSQDTFLIDDSTLAWGQVNDPGSSAQITVAKTQSLPGVGPTDNGGILVALAAHQQPTQSLWPWVLGGAALVLAAGVVAWFIRRSRREAELATTSGDE